MKKIIGLLVLLFCCSIFLNIYLLKGQKVPLDQLNTEDNSPSDIQKTEKNESLSGKVMTDIKKVDKEKEKIIKECNKVISGKKSLIFRGRNFYVNYQGAIELIRNSEKNEYLMIKNMKQGNCDSIFDTERDDNKSFCNSIKNKQLQGKAGSYDYQLLKSIIKNRDFCSDITEQSDSEESYIELCKNTFSKFLNIDAFSDFQSIYDDDLVKGYFLYKNGEKKYLDRVTELFMKECIPN